MRAIVVWAVKADRRAVPPDLAAALARRADIVVSSRREYGFVREAFEAAGVRRRPPVRIATRGGECVSIRGEGTETLVPVETFKADDTTGAGDTFLGGFLAAWRPGEVERAVESGVAAASAPLLRRRKGAWEGRVSARAWYIGCAREDVGESALLTGDRARPTRSVHAYRRRRPDTIRDRTGAPDVALFEAIVWSEKRTLAT